MLDIETISKLETTIAYKDGTVKRDVKYKHVEDDVIAGKAVLVE